MLESVSNMGKSKPNSMQVPGIMPYMNGQLANSKNQCNKLESRLALAMMICGKGSCKDDMQ